MANPQDIKNDPADRLRWACAEVVRRLRIGEQHVSESLLAAMPELAADADMALELVYTEFATREELGHRPQPPEFLKRFPTLAPALARQLEVHALLAESADETRESSNPSGQEPPSTDKKLSAGEDQQVGDYHILSEVARGAMGVVYKAQHRMLGRIVGLKLPQNFPGADGSRPVRQSSLARFSDEARLMAALRHPNIVHIDEIGTDGQGRPFLACEWVDGGTLASRTGGRALDAREAAELIQALAEAVDCAHRLGILHCDLSPANVLLAADGTPKIADFGLARLRREGVDPDEATVLAGTPTYMAPEQVSHPERIGPATDIYGLGAVLYELLVGRPPFLGRTGWETLSQVVGQTPESPRRLRPGLSRDLEAICLKCLAKKPTDRYATAAQLADDLGRWLAGQPVAAQRGADRTALESRGAPAAHGGCAERGHRSRQRFCNWRHPLQRAAAGGLDANRATGGRDSRTSRRAERPVGRIASQHFCHATGAGRNDVGSGAGAGRGAVARRKSLSAQTCVTLLGDCCITARLTIGKPCTAPSRACWPSACPPSRAWSRSAVAER